LHAVAVVKAGVFSILKVTLYIFGTGFISTSGAADWLVWVAGATILLASLVAMSRDNLKARLAYSTISQLGYVVLGALLVTQSGIVGGALQITMHAFAKITLFFAAGAIIIASQRTEISDMAGLGRAMPVTFGAFFVGSLSIIGLPPFGGLWSKWYLGMGTLEAGQTLLLGVLLLSSLLNIAYLLPVPVRAFFGTAPAAGNVGIREAPASCLVAMLITAAACLLLFFWPDPFYRLALAAGASG
jgi:multicomponent Na+:H+ antiporter subunit D